MAGVTVVPKSRVVMEVRKDVVGGLGGGVGEDGMRVVWMKG